MAIEDEIINISDLDPGMEIVRGDKLLIETSNGTKLLDFKDFVIGPENISFYDQISSAFGGSYGDALVTTSSFETLCSFNVATTATPPGHLTKFKDVSGATELAKFNHNTLTDLTAVTGQIYANQTKIEGLDAQLTNIAATIPDVVTITLSSCNFSVKQVGVSQFDSDFISFTNIDINPTDSNSDETLGFTVNDGATNNPGFKITYPTGDSYVQSQILFTGRINVEIGKIGGQGGNRPDSRVAREEQASNARITLIVNGDTIAEFGPVNLYRTLGGQFTTGSGAIQNVTFDFTQLVSVPKGAVVKLGSTNPRHKIVDGSTFAGIKVV